MPDVKDRISYFSLRSFKVGGQEIGFSRDDQKLHIAGDEYSVEDWQAIVDRVQTAMERKGWVDKPKKGAGSPPWGGRSSSFLSANVTKIHQVEQGYLRRAPLWLRWLYPWIVTHEEYRDA